MSSKGCQAVCVGLWEADSREGVFYCAAEVGNHIAVRGLADAEVTGRDLLADQNPTVVANAVASLVEISDRSDDISLRLNATVAGKLVAALGECSE